MTHRSVGTTPAVRRGLDLSQPGAIEHVAATRSHRGEIILFTSDAAMGGWAFHFVLTLRRVGYEHWFILADSDATCEALHEQWRQMEVQHAEPPLACARCRGAQRSSATWYHSSPTRSPIA